MRDKRSIEKKIDYGSIKQDSTCNLKIQTAGNYLDEYEGYFQLKFPLIGNQ